MHFPVVLGLSSECSVIAWVLWLQHRRPSLSSDGSAGSTQPYQRLSEPDAASAEAFSGSQQLPNNYLRTSSLGRAPSFTGGPSH